MNDASRKFWQQFDRLRHKALTLLSKKPAEWTEADRSVALRMVVLDGKAIAALLGVVAPCLFDQAADDGAAPKEWTHEAEALEFLEDAIAVVNQTHFDALRESINKAIDRYVAACGVETASPRGKSIRRTLLTRFLPRMASDGVLEDMDVVSFWLNAYTSKVFADGLSPKLAAVDPETPALLRQHLSKPDPREQAKL